MAEIDGLIIPGGESTTMLKLLHYENLFEALAEFGRRKPIFGTCAGAILMAKDVHESRAGEPRPDGYRDGAQRLRPADRQPRGGDLDPDPEFESARLPAKLEAVFIRAPIIRRVEDGDTVLASYQGDPVLIEQGRHLVATFHPELTEDPRVHRLFLAKL